MLLAVALPFVGLAASDSQPTVADCADVVVIGEVKSVTSSRTEDDRLITTRILIDVTRVPRGDLEIGHVVFNQLGGEIDGVRLDISSSPRPGFQSGQLVVLLFERTDDALMARALVQGRETVESYGLISGRFHITDGPGDRPTLLGEPPGPRLWFADNGPGLRELLGLSTTENMDLALYFASLSGSPVPCTGGTE